MPRGEKLFRFLAKLMVDRFYGAVTIKFEARKATHIETETRRVCEYGQLSVMEATEGARNTSRDSRVVTSGGEQS